MHVPQLGWYGPISVWNWHLYHFTHPPRGVQVLPYPSHRLTVVAYSRQRFKGTGQLFFFAFCNSLPVYDLRQIQVFLNSACIYNLSAQLQFSTKLSIWLSFLKRSLITVPWEYLLSPAWISAVSVRISRSLKMTDWLCLPLNYHRIPLRFFLLCCNNKDKQLHTHFRQSMQRACFWAVGGNQCTWKKPAQTMGEYANSTYKCLCRIYGCYENTASLKAHPFKMRRKSMSNLNNVKILHY